MTTTNWNMKRDEVLIQAAQAGNADAASAIEDRIAKIEKWPNHPASMKEKVERLAALRAA